MSKQEKEFNLFSMIYLRNFVTVMVGMFTFGFVDNFILVLAGEAIDNTISASFGFSPMFSAGVGNAISDVIGVLLGSFMATLVYKLFGEVKEEDVSRGTFLVAQAVGIFLGCMVGLFPLAFL